MTESAAITQRNPQTMIISVVKVNFHDVDNNSVVLSGKLDNGKLRRVTGTLADPVIGSIVKATGCWKHHDKYGWQFKADELKVLCQNPLTDTREGLQCKITFVKELRQDTGFCVAGGLLEDGSAVRLSGRLGKMSKGIEVFMLGEWHDDEQYGREFRVRQWEYYKPEHPGSLQKCYELMISQKASSEPSAKIVEFAWEDVELKDGLIIVPYPEGGRTACPFPEVRESYNRIKSFLQDRLPKLQISFGRNGMVTVLNPGIIRDAVTLLHVSHTLRYGTMETREKNRDIMNIVGDMSAEATREFVPRDVTMYLDFLQDHQSEYFNIVPVEEFNGGSREEAFLFTVMIGESPCIVWENTNPSRATFVFPCTDEEYRETMEIICSFIADEKTGKRQYLHSDSSKETFGFKPTIIVHNTFESWTKRLMAIN